MVEVKEEPSAFDDQQDASLLEIIEEWKQSGLSMTEWTRNREDITYYQLSKARRRLCAEEVYGKGKENTWSAITMNLPSTSINVHLNGCRIEVPPGFDQTLFSEIVEVLKNED